MDTELGRILKTIWRWSWLIILCVLLAGGATAYSLSNTPPVYEASTTLQFSTPDRSDTEIGDEYIFRSERDDTRLAISTFINTAESDAVRDATIFQLGLDELDAEYELTVASSQDADFIDITVASLNPELAAQVVNVHSTIARQQFGELRARPASDSKLYFERQIQAIGSQLSDANQRLDDFRVENDLTALETDKKLTEDALIQLQTEQTKLVAENAIGQAQQVVRLETRINDQRNELTRLVALEPEYNRLEREKTHIEETEKLLLTRYTEADLKEALAREVNFIQIITPATPPAEPASNALQTLIMSIVGSLGLGLVLAFLLDYLLGYNKAPAPRSEQVVIGSDVVVNRIRSTNDLKHIRSSREFERLQSPATNGLQSPPTTLQPTSIDN